MHRLQVFGTFYTIIRGEDPNVSWLVIRPSFHRMFMLHDLSQESYEGEGDAVSINDRKLAVVFSVMLM
jgi:hypothetical protein